MVKRQRKPAAKTKQPISAADVRKWRQFMGLSERDAAKRLGMSRGFLRTCEQEGAPLYVGLALAALAANLPPFSATQQDQNWISFGKKAPRS